MSSKEPSSLSFARSIARGVALWDLQVVTAQWTVLEDWSFDDLRAPYWRLYWNPVPGASISVEDRQMDISPEYLYLIPPETSYSSSVASATDHFYVHFLTSQRWSPGGVPVVPIQPSEVDLVRSLRRDKGADNSGWQIVALVAAVLGRLPKAGWGVGTIDDQRIWKARRAIEGRAPEAVSPVELALDAGMNVNAFIRLFRQKVGLTPAKYAMARRIEIACMLLHHSDRTIDDIAKSCGFCDRHHFTRCFSKIRGIAPAAFRQQAKPVAEGNGRE